jgi:DNA polymerase-1
MAKKENKNKKLVLLDSHAILHRAYHALPDFATKAGEPTGALYGLSAMLIKIIQDLNPDYLIAAYDLPGPTYRHEAYKEYKAGRAKADGELVSQIIRSREIFEAFGIPIYDRAGFEADDIIGTIVEKSKKMKDTDVVIASGDMDTLQLVNGKKVQVYTLKKGIKDTIVYDEDMVVERYGFPPKNLIDYKGLRGDPSDNIIGIQGIGEKTATELILKFGSIEEMYKTLRSNREAFVKAGIKERIIKLLEDNEEEAEFSKMLATIKCDVPIDFKLPEIEFGENLDIKKVDKLFGDLEFRVLRDRARAMFNSTATLGFGAGTEVTQETESAEEVQPADLKEVSIALWVLDSTRLNPDLEEILEYADTRSFTKAREKIFKDLEKEDLMKVYVEIEKPLIPIVDKMERAGVKVDTLHLKKLSIEYHKELAKNEKKIYQLAGQEFNINSPRQLGEILFDKLGLKIKGHKKTPGGARSTRESEIEKLKDEHPIIAEILKHRELQKLLSTYIDALPTSVADDGRIHSTFLQAGSVTGRMASHNPNLQNIPVSDIAGGVRKAFVADYGKKLVAFDYSQIELRIAAMLSGDKKLVEIFRMGKDVHTAVAVEVFGVKEKDVTGDMRRQAKVINFGILYGMGVNALRTNLGSDRETAQKFYNDYFREFSGLADYLEKVKAETYRRGYTETFFGRKRRFPDIKSKLPFIRAAAERMAINAPIQGTSADLIKVAMVKIDEYLEESKMGEHAKLILQVHDELIYEMEEGVVEKISKEIRIIMESVLPLSKTLGIKFDANSSVAPNWAELKKIDVR